MVCGSSFLFQFTVGILLLFTIGIFCAPGARLVFACADRTQQVYWKYQVG